MKRVVSIGILVLLIIGLFYGCTEQKTETNDKIINEYDIDTLNSRFGFMHPDDFQDMTDLGIFWQRPHPGPFIWGEIEKNPGNYDWSNTDKEVKKSQGYGVNIIATIWPFTDWDQSSCHSEAPSAGSLIFFELGRYRQKPCDMESYQNFTTNLVERYDGDGIDDMTDLVVPIKYWEVSNEPSMQEDPLVFFLGPAEDYLDLLNTTYQTIKSVDSDAKVLHGGMAGVMDDNIEFWEEIIHQGGTNYFDIGNIHSINSDSKAINGPEYKAFLDDHGIEKPFWITEVEIGSMDKEKGDVSGEDMANSLITNFVSAFESGAEKIFHPGIMKQKEGDPSSKFKDDKESVYTALKVLVKKLDYFESVEKIGEGQFKFIFNNSVVYVLWGENDIPEEISGNITVTDVSGLERILDAEELSLTESPVFIEI